MLRRALVGFVVAAAVVAPAAAAYAADPTPPLPPQCQQADESGALPTCTYDGSSWNVEYGAGSDIPVDGTADNGPNIGAIAAVGFAVVIGLGIASTVWRVRAARRIATGAGLDPDAAAAATLLGTGGLTATYLAANLHQRPPLDVPPVRPVVPPARTVEDRLAELGRLHGEGLVTDEEYATRRSAIIDGV